MRVLIRNDAMVVAGLSVGITSIPNIIGVIWILTAEVARRDQVAHLIRDNELDLGLSAGGLLVAEIVLAFAVSWWVSHRVALKLAAPLVELANVADRFAAEDTRMEAMASGVREIDEISGVLARGSQQIGRNLARQRDFASDASHQLRTPLTALLMRLEEIASTDDPAVVAEEATVAIEQVERLSRVVDDLMARGRSESSVQRPSVSLDSVLATLQREWQPAFADARRSIHVTGERGLRVRSTPVALGQIMSTLLENSLSHGRGTVAVAARRTGPSVVVEVSDQGEGVPATIAPHIFERSVSSTGSGLGLTLARDLAESNGGRLELISAQPAVFALFLSEAEG